MNTRFNRRDFLLPHQLRQAGDYILFFNYENTPTANMPFPKLYYPGIKEREKAMAISVKHGENLTDLKIVLN